MSVKSNWISTWFQADTAGVDSNSNKMILEERKLGEDWLRKYAPRIPSELIVQKTKQDVINAWLEEAKKKVGLVLFLIMTGPSGCGKTAALRILAKAQSFEIVEWITPLDIENYERGPGSYMQSQSSKFQEFLVSTGRYVSVFGDGKDAKKLILVKDIPNAFLVQPNLLQDVLRHYSTVGRYPVVFSIPEQMEGFNSLFPKTFIKELNIQQLSFNKIPNKSILKVLKKICSINKGSAVLSGDVLDTLVDNCNGDIRNAILQLCYESAQTSHNSNSTKVLLKQKLKKNKKESKNKLKESGEKGLQSMGISGKDAQIPIFQRVGRLLYPKKSSSDLGELIHDPEEIVEQTLSQPRRFMHMVHENYLKIFRDMNAVCRAIKYSSDSDTMISEFRERDLTLPMALSTITRGFMTCSVTANRKWMPLTNQENALMRKRTQVLRDIITNVDPKYVLTPRDASMDILPIICPGYSIRKTSYRQIDSEMCSSSDEEAPSTLDRNKRSKTCIAIDINSFSHKRSKLNERGVTDVDKQLDSYEIEEIQSDAEDEVNANDGWVDEDVDFLDNLDI